MVFKHLELFLSKHRSLSSKKQSLTVIEELCHRFSLTDIRKSTDNFDESRIISGDNFGDVYEGCLKYNFAATDCKVIIKKIKNDFSSPFTDLPPSEMFKNEIELLCQLNHPNLIPLIGFCHHKDEKIIVYEYMSNGSLDKHLHAGVIEPLSWKKRLEICVGIARGLHYLHSGLKRTIIHRDVKPSNILLDSNMVPKLTGFGLSLRGPHFMSQPKPIQRKIDRYAGTTNAFREILYLVAYECLIGGTYSDKSDVFAFGLLLLEVVCAIKPYNISDNTPIEEKIDPVLEGKIAPECWEIYVSIAEMCVKNDPNERPTMGEVEVELEQALRLQEQADIIRDNNSYYTLLSNTTIYLYGTTSVEYMSDSATSFEIGAETEENDEDDSVPRS